MILQGGANGMDDRAIMNVAAFVAVCGGIALCVRFDQQGKTRRRELEHAERMRAIELGHPIDDAGAARYRAIGAIGVAVPIVSLSAAAIGSCFAMMFREPEWRFGALALVWLVCGAVCLAVLPAVSARLRESAPDRAVKSDVAGSSRPDDYRDLMET